MVSGVTAPAPVLRSMPGILYLADMTHCSDRHEALQVEQLVEGGRDVAGLQAVDGRRGQIDTADDDVAGLLAGLLEDLGEHAGDAAVLGADRLQVGMALDVGHQDRNGERRVGVDLLGDLQAVDLEAGLLQRVGEALLGLAALGLAEHAIDHRLVAGLQALGEHVVGGQRAAGIEVDAGIAHALGLELVLQRGHRRVADGDHDALVDGALDDVMEGGGARVAHDLDAVRLGGDRLLELVDHGLRRPGRELLLQVDAEGGGGLRGAGLAGKRGAVAGVAAHLHVHDQAFADRSSAAEAAPRLASRAVAAAPASRILVTCMFVLSLLFGTAPSGARRYSAALARPKPLERLNRAKKARRRCGSST